MSILSLDFYPFYDVMQDTPLKQICTKKQNECGAYIAYEYGESNRFLQTAYFKIRVLNG